jgi:hypothetical protein
MRCAARSGLCAVLLCVGACAPDSHKAPATGIATRATLARSPGIHLTLGPSKIVAGSVARLEIVFDPGYTFRYGIRVSIDRFAGGTWRTEFVARSFPDQTVDPPPVLTPAEAEQAIDTLEAYQSSGFQLVRIPASLAPGKYRLAKTVFDVSTADRARVPLAGIVAVEFTMT